MANITKLAVAGDSLTDVAGTEGIDHWYHLGIRIYPEWFAALDPQERPFSVARAGASLQVVQGEHGAAATSHWRLSGFGGNGWINQVYQQLSPTHAIGVGAVVEAGTSNSVFFWLGPNDLSFLQNNAFESLYNDSWTSEQREAYRESMLDSLFDGISDTLEYGSAQVIVSTIVSYTQSPFVQAHFPDADKRERVENFVRELNADLISRAQAAGYPVCDMYQLYRDLLGPHENPTATMQFGGNTIQLQSGSSENPNFYAFQREMVEDEVAYVHPTTTIASIHLVAILMAFKIAYGHEYTKPSESTMCSWCTGLATGGADTRNFRYENYVRAFNLDTTGVSFGPQVYVPGGQMPQVYVPGGQLAQVAA